MSEQHQISSISLPNRAEFYSKAEKYWSKVDASIDGMLGGLSELDESDAQYSLKMIDKFQKDGSTKICLDVGAGIGRVSKHVLLKKYNSVDLLEVDKKFLDEAPNFLGENLSKRVGKYYNVGMQDFEFEKKYDCIWIQWCIGHLTDLDAKKFLGDCQKHLNGSVWSVISLNRNST